MFGKTSSDKPPEKEEWVEKTDDDTDEVTKLKKMFKMDPEEA